MPGSGLLSPDVTGGTQSVLDMIGGAAGDVAQTVYQVGASAGQAVSSALAGVFDSGGQLLGYIPPDVMPDVIAGTNQASLLNQAGQTIGSIINAPVNAINDVKNIAKQLGG